MHEANHQQTPSKVFPIMEPVVAIGIIVVLGFVHWPTEAALGYQRQRGREEWPKASRLES